MNNYRTLIVTITLSLMLVGLTQPLTAQTPTPDEVGSLLSDIALTPLPPQPLDTTGLTIDELSTRSYGGGELTLHETLADRQGYTRHLFSYPSDELTIYGFMNVPKSPPPYPIAVVLHGHVPAEQYRTETYTRRYADALAESGYLVLHPNMRGFAPSDDGPDWFRIGLATDVLNLLAITRETAGQPGPLEQADANFIGLMGHSMGGGVALRVSVIDSLLNTESDFGVDATVLYGSMSGDERQNYEQILQLSNGEYGQRELATSDEELAQISPIFYLDSLAMPLSLHHGEGDGSTLAWGVDLCNRLQTLSHPAECFVYEGQSHTFSGEGDALFTQRLINFFDQVRLDTWSATPQPTPPPTPTATPDPLAMLNAAEIPIETTFSPINEGDAAVELVETDTIELVETDTEVSAEVASDLDFRIASWRLWPLALNSGCSKGMHVIFITVLDAAGNPLDNVIVGDSWNNVEVMTGSKGTGKAEIDLWANTMEVVVKRDGVTGQEYRSEVSFPFSSYMTTIPNEQMIQAGYCANEAECDWKREFDSFYCGGHYSWEVIFQRTY